MSTIEPSTQKLVDDFKAVARDAEELIRSLASDAGAATHEAREKLASALDSAKESCEKLEAKAAEGAKCADEFVRENPYCAMGVALGAGLLIGALIFRR